MIQTPTQLCNQALSLLRVAPITDFTTDTRNIARECRVHFWPSVDELLQRFPWSFALKRATLSIPLQDAPAWGYDNAYALPVDFFRMVSEESDDNTEVSWSIEGRTILTDEPSLSIRYISSDLGHATDKWPPLFQQTLTYLMAAKLAVPLAGSTSQATLYHGKVHEVLAEGENADSHRDPSTYASDALIRVRY